MQKAQAPGERLGLGRDGHGQLGLPVTLNHALASATSTVTTSTFSRFAHASYAPRAIMSKVPACPAFLQTTSAAVAAGAFMIGVGARNSRADFERQVQQGGRRRDAERWSAAWRRNMIPRLRPVNQNIKP